MKLKHICEVCGREEILTPEEAYRAGWDYPPKMGMFGVVSQRTCPQCPINRTVWWKLAVEHNDLSALSDDDKATIERILHEPESILVDEWQHGFVAVTEELSSLKRLTTCIT